MIYAHPIRHQTANQDFIKSWHKLKLLEGNMGKLIFSLFSEGK
jgi:hypothetical protein